MPSKELVKTSQQMMPPMPTVTWMLPSVNTTAWHLRTLWLLRSKHGWMAIPVPHLATQAFTPWSSRALTLPASGPPGSLLTSSTLTINSSRSLTMVLDAMSPLDQGPNLQATLTVESTTATCTTSSKQLAPTPLTAWHSAKPSQLTHLPPAPDTELYMIKSFTLIIYRKINEWPI